MGTCKDSLENEDVPHKITKGVRSHDHLCLGPDLTLVACLSTGVCQAPCWTAWTGQEESSLVSRNQTSSSDSDRPTMSPVLLSIAWTFLSQNEPGVCFSKHLVMQEVKQWAPCIGVGFPAPGEPAWIPGLEDVGPQMGSHAGPWEQ